MEAKASPLQHPEPGSTNENQPYFHCVPFWRRKSEQALIFFRVSLSMEGKCIPVTSRS